MPPPEEQQDAAIARFAFELGVLKRIRRRLVACRVRDPKSVAEHSLRVA